MNKEQFAPCPFCGKSDTLTIGKASDAFSELDDCGDPLPYMHTESYSVVCDSSKPDGPGGCGASGGYFPSEHEAVAAWNRRAEVERLAAQAEPAPAPVGEYPAKALEVVEPVACLVNADLGAMVWPISDIGEAGTYCDEGEFPELLYSAATVSALQARIATQAEHQAKALEGVQAFEFDPPPYNSAAMGCGLEDRGATDIYDAMYYGWHEAMDRAYESIPDDLVSASAVSALRERIAELDAQVASLVADIAHADSLLSAGNDKGDYFNIETEMCWLSWQAAIAYAMAEAVKACEADRLDDTTGTEGDAAYNRAIGHCITAIKEALK